MLDHVFTQLVASHRHAFEAALLQRQAVEERFQVDVFLGDVSFETSYSLPGEQNPPRVRADLSLEWPTWSQSAYRSWSIGEASGESPEIIVEIALRIQRLASSPSVDAVIAAIGDSLPHLGSTTLERAGATVEQSFESEREQSSSAVEVSFQGAYRIDEQVLEDPEKLDPDLHGLARWIASSLVRLADLDLQFLPVEDSDDHA